MDYRILHLIQTSGPGGAENLFLNLIQRTRRKYKTTAGLIKKGWLYQQLEQRGIDVKVLPSGGSFDLKLIKNIATFIRKEQINIIQSHLFDMNFYSSIAARIARIPHICTEHGDIHHIAKKADINTKIKAITILNLTKELIFVSQFTRDQFLRIARGPTEKTKVIYNGIALEEYESQIDIYSIKSELGLKTNQLIVGNVANLYPVKGHRYFLQAAKEVLQQIPHTRFLVIGKGPLENELKNEALKIGIFDYVKFLGFRDDVRDLLKIMDVFVLPSLSEGLPLSLIEAMASKVPIVASNVGGISEIVSQGKNGFLVSPGCSDILASKIITLLRDKYMAKKLGMNGYRKVKSQFSLQQMVNKYVELYSVH